MSECHYYDEGGNPLPEFEFIYTKLKCIFGEHVPDKITVQYWKEGYSAFCQCSGAIRISGRVPEDWLFKAVAHETCHLCLADITDEASVLEELRFIDEGYASIFGYEVKGAGESYKERALACAAYQHSLENVSFEKLRKWSEYYGDPETRTNPYAYPAGSSFDYFVMDTFGTNAFFSLLESLRTHRELSAAVEEVFNRDLRDVESAWLSYLEAVPHPAVLPGILGLFPEDNAVNVDPNIKEIIVDFTVQMEKRVVLISDCDKDISHENAYWQSLARLAVKVRLTPGKHYSVRLGDSRYGFFASSYWVEMPAFVWRFSTASA